MTVNSFSIREFDVNDTDEVIALWHETFKNDPSWNDPLEIITRKQAVQKELFLVGVFKRRIVAAVLGGYDGFRGWVYHLAVDPEYQGRSFGRKMMEAIEKKLLDLNCPKINLQIRSQNSAVISFYENLGYDVEDHTSMGKVLRN
jgi:ribosomal protein S18 acetylase RimI-like enzyme